MICSPDHRTVEIPGGAIGLPMLQHVSRVQSHHAIRNAWHSHPGFELVFLLDGASGYEFENHQTVELHGGHFLVIPPRILHRGQQGVRAPYTKCGLALNTTAPRAWRNTPFTLADSRRMLAALQRGSRKAHAMDPSLRWQVCRLMTEVLGFKTQGRRGEAQATLRALVCVVLVETVHQGLASPTTPGVFVSAAIAYLREHIHDTIYMTDLVRHLGYSRTRVFEMFKAETGLPPNEYLQRVRIEEAEKLLRQTNKSVTEIALATGFGSGQHFSLIFRCHTGLSPARFRKGAKPRNPSPLPSPAR